MFNANKVNTLVERVKAGGGEGTQAIADLLVDLYLRNDALAAELAKMRKVAEHYVKSLRNGGGKERQQEAVQGAAPPVNGNGGGVRVGADGTPITDPSQLAAEEAMDAAMGIQPGQSAPAPSQRGGVRVGADGTPITDASQLAAEEAMDAAMGINQG